MRSGSRPCQYNPHHDDRPRRPASCVPRIRRARGGRPAPSLRREDARRLGWRPLLLVRAGRRHRRQVHRGTSAARKRVHRLVRRHAAGLRPPRQGAHHRRKQRHPVPQSPRGRARRHGGIPGGPRRQQQLHRHPLRGPRTRDHERPRRTGGVDALRQARHRHLRARCGAEGRDEARSVERLPRRGARHARAPLDQRHADDRRHRRRRQPVPPRWAARLPAPPRRPDGGALEGHRGASHPGGTASHLARPAGRLHRGTGGKRAARPRKLGIACLRPQGPRDREPAVRRHAAHRASGDRSQRAQGSPRHRHARGTAQRAGPLRCWR